MSKKVFIGVGHGGTDSGAVKYIVEKEYTLKTAFALSEILSKYGVDFKPNGYTRTVDRGDGDYLTADTIWDFKVSKAKPNKMHTLQLLMYWIMGQHSGQGVFKTIHNIGIFNLRSNEVYLYDTNNLPKEIVGIIKNEIICY